MFVIFIKRGCVGRGPVVIQGPKTAGKFNRDGPPDRPKYFASTDGDKPVVLCAPQSMP